MQSNQLQFAETSSESSWTTALDVFVFRSFRICNFAFSTVYARVRIARSVLTVSSCKNNRRCWTNAGVCQPGIFRICWLNAFSIIEARIWTARTIETSKSCWRHRRLRRCILWRRCCVKKRFVLFLVFILRQSSYPSFSSGIVTNACTGSSCNCISFKNSFVCRRSGCYHAVIWSCI